MKKKLATCASILLGFLTNSAVAYDNTQLANLSQYSPGHLYLEGKGGGSWGDIKSISAKPLSGTTAVTVNKKEARSTRWMYGGAIGYQFGSTAVPVRIETEYMYRDDYQYNRAPVFEGRSEQIRSTIVNQAIMANLFIDVPVSDMWMIFIGGGAGVAMNRTYVNYVSGSTTTTDTTDRNEFAWMASAGFGVQVTDWFAVNLSYRFSDLGAIRWSVSESGMQMNSKTFHAHEGMLGFRLSMPPLMRQMMSNPQATQQAMMQQQAMQQQAMQQQAMQQQSMQQSYMQQQALHSGNAPSYKSQAAAQAAADAAEIKRRQMAYGNIYADK